MKTFQEFITEAKKCWPGCKKKGTKKLFGKTYNNCVKEGKVEWDNPKRPLQSGMTPREKNRVMRKRLEVFRGLGSTRGRSFTSSGPSEREYERYGGLILANQEQSGLKPPKENLHKFKDDKKGKSARKKYAPQTFRSLKEPKENFEYPIEEGKVEWDNPKRPLQSGLTPREKNRAKRISTNVENPDRVSFGGKTWDVNDKDYERYGKLKAAHDDEKGKKVPANKRQQFNQVKDADGVEIGTKGQQTRRFKDQKNIKSKLNSKLYKNDERQKVYHHNDLKEPKESFEFELEESSTGERSRGRATLGRAGNKMDRRERTVAAIAKKAGLKGTGKYSTKDLRTKPKDYTTYDSDDDLDDVGSTEQDHYIRTHSSPRSFATDLMSKSKPAGRNAFGRLKHKVRPSEDSVKKVKDLRKSITKVGADKQGPVHIVDIMHRDSSVGKGDRTQQIERGKNFIQALKDTPKHLKKAQIEASKDTPKHLKRKPPRARKNPLVGGTPTAVMSGESKKTGAAKRAKLYSKIFGNRSSKVSPNTGLMVGKAD